MSTTVQLEKSSDESVVSLTLPPAPLPVDQYLPPQPRITGLFPGGKVPGSGPKPRESFLLSRFFGLSGGVAEVALTCPQENSRPCKVTTNHFSVVLEVPQGVIYMYDVTVEPPWSRPYRRSVLLHGPSYRVFF